LSGQIAMSWHRFLIVLVLASMALGGSAAALPVARLEPDAVIGAGEHLRACARTGCLQPVQMPMWPFGDRRRADEMPAGQRELLTRLLSPELSEVVSPAERQILSQALERGDRLSAEAVGELSAMLRDKQNQQAQRLATAKAEAERQRQAELAAEAERQRQREQTAAEAERRREAEQAAAEAERQRQPQAPTAAEVERRRQTEQAAAEAERQRQAKLAAAEAERQRQVAAAAEAERRRQAQLAAAEAERQREVAEAARILAEAKREAEAAAANAARLVFYDEFPPLQPL
jgi:hypothetical protein